MLLRFRIKNAEWNNFQEKIKIQSFFSFILRKIKILNCLEFRIMIRISCDMLEISGGTKSFSVMK